MLPYFFNIRVFQNSWKMPKKIIHWFQIFWHPNKHFSFHFPWTFEVPSYVLRVLPIPILRICPSSLIIATQRGKHVKHIPDVVMICWAQQIITTSGICFTCFPLCVAIIKLDGHILKIGMGRTLSTYEGTSKVHGKWNEKCLFGCQKIWNQCIIFLGIFHEFWNTLMLKK